MTVPNYLIKERDDFHQDFIDISKKSIKNPKKNIIAKMKKTRKYHSHHVLPWSETEIDSKPFSNDLESLKPGKWLYSTTIDFIAEAMIHELAFDDIVGYLGIYALDNITFNNPENIFHLSYLRTLFNKNLLFITIMSNNINYVPKDHFFLGIICIKTRQILILDSMVSGKKLENYSMSFLALINLTKLIYSTCYFAEFSLNEWKFILSNDCALQDDGNNCGVFVLANICCILNKFQMSELKNPEQARYYFRNLGERNIENVKFCNVAPNTYPEYNFLKPTYELEIDIVETSEIVGMLLPLSLSNFYDFKCSYDNCSASKEKKYICSVDRTFYCNSHNFFEKTDDIYFKICKNCYYIKFVKKKFEKLSR